VKSKIYISLYAALASLISSAEHPIKLYSLYTPSHTAFAENWFIPTLTDNCELIIRHYPQECAQAQWMRPGWTDTTRHKIELILDAIEENWGTVFIYADIDIQFFAPFVDKVLQKIEGLDFVFQRHNPDGIVCSGFFACRAHEKTKQFFLAVQKMMHKNKKMSDQPAINYCLAKQADILWDYLPDTFFGGGTRAATSKAWEPGDWLDIPEGIILHHANCTRGIKNKIAQLEYVRKIVTNTMK
jgi:hypothetical protein